MATKRKGQLTTSPEWAKHLRPFMHRLFWKGERRSEATLIQDEATYSQAPPIIEFLIRRSDGEWFDLHRDEYDSVFLIDKITMYPAESTGDYCISYGDVLISVCNEDLGFHITFEGDISFSEADKIVNEFVHKIFEKTSQQGKIVAI